MSRPPLRDETTTRPPAAEAGPRELHSAELLPLHDGEEGEEGTDGLELDAQQSEEIRRIFATTLPQYIVPVEEMIEQLLSGSGGTEAAEALLGTIRSLAAAAARMGFQAVQENLEGLAASVERLEAGPGQAADRSAREEVIGSLLDLKDLASSLGVRTGAAAPEGTESLVRALSRPDASGVTPLEHLAAEGGTELLPRLSAAGLVSVEQLRTARPDEVAAVTGLPLAVVSRLLGLLGLPGRGAPSARPASPPDRPDPDLQMHGPSGSEGSSSASVLVLPTDPLRRELVLQLRRQVEAEADVDELRVEVHRLRSSTALQRREIDAIEQDRRALESAARRGAEQLQQRRHQLERLRAERASLCEAVAEASLRLRQHETRLLELREERQRIAEEDTRMGREVQALVDRVGGLLRQVARGRTPERIGGSRGSE